MVGVYGLGKCQRLIALLREAGYARADLSAWRARRLLRGLRESFGVRLGPLKPATGAKREEMKGAIVLAPPSAIADRWSRRMPDRAHLLRLGLDAGARTGAAAAASSCRS